MKNTSDIEKMAYTIDEASAAFGISRSLLYTVVHRADFPTVRVGRRVLIPKKSLEAWLLAQVGTEV